MQTMIEIHSPFFLLPEQIPSAKAWSGIFGNDRPLVLEIGCGIGDFVVKTAAESPELNFIAVDYYNKGCLKTCRRVEKAGLANVRVVRGEARELLQEKLLPGTLRRVYINCPDPWPKKRHRKRRLVSPSFLEFLRPYLAEGGDWYFATDFEDYGLDVAAFMPRVQGMENVLSPDPYRHHLEGYHLSKYMLKFLAEGKRIHFVHYRKKESACAG